MCPECALVNRSVTLMCQLAPVDLSATFRVASIAVPAPAAILRSGGIKRKKLSKCLPANSPGPSLSALRPSRSRAVPTGSSAQPPAAPHPLPVPPLLPAAHPLPAAAPAAGDPTPGLDRPQGDHRARSAACPPRASQSRHQRVRR